MHESGFDRKIRQLLPKARTIWYNIFAIDGLHIIFSKNVNAILGRTEMMLMDSKIGNGGLQLQRCSIGNHASSHMDLHTGIEDMGHICNFL